MLAPLRAGLPATIWWRDSQTEETTFPAAIHRRDAISLDNARDGVGALITVQGADGERAPVTRWVARSSGFNSSLPREQLIGLGTREAPYSVEVSWPSGIVQTLSIDRSRTRTAVVEPD